MRCDNTDTNTNAYADSTTTHTDSNSAPTDSYTNANANSNSAPTDPYANANADSDPYCYTNTDYGLSTNLDDRPYQGSQYAVQFHGTGQPH